jgi:F420H(2)-dependent quinone reductase
MMLGATAPSVGWPTVATLCWAGLTGLVAGATLGAVLGWFAPSLQGVAPHNRVVLAMLRQGRPRRLAGALLGLRITGRRTGRAFGFPLRYAEADGVLWVAVGRSHRKTWWRNVAPQAPAEVLQHGYWHPAVADLVPPADDRYPGGLALYTRRWPKVGLEPADPLVRIASEERP